MKEEGERMKTDEDMQKIRDLDRKDRYENW